MKHDLQNAIDMVARLMPDDKPWWIIGSTAMALSGIDIEPDDVDVLSDGATITAALAKLGVAPPPPAGNDRFRSFPFASYQAPGASRIEFMGDLELNEGGAWGRLTITTRQPVRAGGAVVFVPDLIEQRHILQRFGREKDVRKAALISAFLTP